MNARSSPGSTSDRRIEVDEADEPHEGGSAFHLTQCPRIRPDPVNDGAVLTAIAGLAPRQRTR